MKLMIVLPQLVLETHFSVVRGFAKVNYGGVRCNLRDMVQDLNPLPYGIHKGNPPKLLDTGADCFITSCSSLI